MSDDQRRFNTFSFHYRPELIQEREVVEHLAAILEVDGKMFCDFVHLGELIESTSKSGEFEIYTCSCGCAPCSDIPPVRVEQQADSIVWWVHESLSDPESRLKADDPTRDRKSVV